MEKEKLVRTLASFWLWRSEIVKLTVREDAERYVRENPHLVPSLPSEDSKTCINCDTQKVVHELCSECLVKIVRDNQEDSKEGHENEAQLALEKYKYLLRQANKMTAQKNKHSNERSYEVAEHYKKEAESFTLQAHNHLLETLEKLAQENSLKDGQAKGIPTDKHSNEAIKEMLLKEYEEVTRKNKEMDVLIEKYKLKVSQENSRESRQEPSDDQK